MLQFIIVACILTPHRGLKKDMVSFGSYWFICFIHIILCIKLTKSNVLDRLMDMELDPKIVYAAAITSYVSDIVSLFFILE